jgi:nicotinamide mononucleotide transporter
MNFFEIFWQQLLAAHWYEHLAVVTGIASVWFSKKENVLVYPVGLISTIIYIVLSFQNQLIGEASVNFYYTIMSLIGWYLWLQKDHKKEGPLMQISFSGPKEIIFQFCFFGVLFFSLYFLLAFLQKEFYPGVIPWGDAFATATAFTGMYLMVKKKVESWYWWIATNVASIPLYYKKDLVVTSIYYCILLILAFYGLQEWRNKAQKKAATVE